MTRRQFQLNNLLWETRGLLKGAWWVKNQPDEVRKSRAEVDEPEIVQNVCEMIGPVLDKWNPDVSDSERVYVERLFDYLCEETENCGIEIFRERQEETPNILIDNALAINLRYALSTKACARLVKLASTHSREWVTWIVLLDTPDDCATALERMLANTNLDHILIFSFS